VLAERCFHALDHDRVRFRDITGRCAVASAGAAVGVGLCVLAAPEIVVGTVIVVGVVAVGFVIKEALDAYELKWADQEDSRPAPETRPVPEVKPVPVTKPAPPKPSPKKRPKPEPAGQDWPPPLPPEVTERDRRPECKPIPEPHAGKDHAHNKCADQFPPNRYPGMDVLVGGVSFDALQVGVRVLWEIKTHRFDTYPDFIRDQEIEKELEQLSKERDAARACGYDFVVGVSTQAHRQALLDKDSEFKIVVTGCPR
jgi:hypothetical protein